MDNFKLSDHFDKYLEICKIKKGEVSEVQFTETQRAFYAGINSVLIILERIADLTENQAMLVMVDLEKQMNEFFEKDFMWGYENCLAKGIPVTEDHTKKYQMLKAKHAVEEMVNDIHKNADRRGPEKG